MRPGAAVQNGNRSDAGAIIAALWTLQTNLIGPLNAAVMVFSSTRCQYRYCVLCKICWSGGGMVANHTDSSRRIVLHSSITMKNPR